MSPYFSRVSIVNPVIMGKGLDDVDEDLRYWCMTIIENNK